MEVQFQLRRVLADHKLDDHGVIAKIAKAVGVHRHTIARLHANTAKSVSFALLGDICSWLISRGVPADGLPQALIGPADLLQLIGRSTTVRLFLGEFTPTRAGSRGNVPWIARNDAFVSAEVVRYLSLYKTRPEVVTAYVPFRVYTDDAADPDMLEERRRLVFEDRRSASRQFEAIRESNVKRTTTFMVGSQKVNLLVEHLVADLFKFTAFESANDSAPAPFYLAYRENEPRVESGFGGRAPPPGFKGEHEPGVYVLGKDGEWTCYPWVDGRMDAGLAVITLDEEREALEIALFGYSGHATKVIGEFFLKNPHEFWPLPATRDGRRVGIFACVISFLGDHEPGASPATCKVISLDRRVIER